jgi:hypothetical protein
MIIVILPVLVGLGVAGVFLMRRGRKIGGGEPRCAGCGYIVVGLPAPKCPECGADLSRPGAVVTGGRLPPGCLARSIGWTLLCLVGLVVFVNLIWRNFGMPMMPQVRDKFDTVTFYQPKSNGYQSIAVIANTHQMVYGNGADPPPNDLRIDLTLSDGTHRVLAIDGSTLRFRDSPVPGSVPLDSPALVDWLKKASVHGEDDRLAREMAQTVDEVRRVAATGPQVSNTEFMGMGGSSGSSSYPAPWAGWIPFIFGATVWVVGLATIALRPQSARSGLHLEPTPDRPG